MISHRRRILAIGILLMAVLSGSALYGQETRSTGRGIAIGGDVSGSDISIGISADEAEGLINASSQQWRNLTQGQQAAIGQLKNQLGITEGALLSFFTILGENSVPKEQLPIKLAEVAGRFIRLQERMRVLEDDTPDVLQLKSEATRQLEAGNFDEADNLLEKIEQIHGLSLEHRLRQLSEVSAQRGDLAMFNYRFLDAERHYANAARYAPDDQRRSEMLKSQLRALVTQTEEFKDIEAREKAVSLAIVYANTFDKTEQPDLWQEAQFVLGATYVFNDYRFIRNEDLLASNAAFQLAIEGAASVGKADSLPEMYLAQAQNYCELANRTSQTSYRESAFEKFGTALELFRDSSADTVPIINLMLTQCGKDLSEDQKNANIAFLRDWERELITTYNEGQLPDTRLAADLLGNLAGIQAVLGSELKDQAYFERSARTYRIAIKLLSDANLEHRLVDSKESFASVLYEASREKIGVTDLEEAIQMQEDVARYYEERGLPGRMDVDLTLSELKAVYYCERGDGAELNEYLLEVSGAPALAEQDLDEEQREVWMGNRELLEKCKELIDAVGSDASGGDPDEEVSLIQLSIAAAPDAQITDQGVASFRSGVEGLSGCYAMRQSASGLGFSILENDRIPLTSLPQALREQLSGLKIGQTTSVFGSNETGMRVLALCGRQRFKEFSTRAARELQSP